MVGRSRGGVVGLLAHRHRTSGGQLGGVVQGDIGGIGGVVDDNLQTVAASGEWRSHGSGLNLKNAAEARQWGHSSQGVPCCPRCPEKSQDTPYTELTEREQEPCARRGPR